MSQLSQQDQPRSAHGRQMGDGVQPAPRMFPTQNYLAEDVRMEMIPMLNQILADVTDLRTQAKYAHWNVRGQAFFQLHELFDELAAVLEEYVDMIAERATALGGQALGTARLSAANSRLPEMQYDTVSGPEFVQIVAERVSLLDTYLCEAIRTAESYEDLDTADLLNEISRDVSKYLWFLEAHLQDQPQAGIGPR